MYRPVLQHRANYRTRDPIARQRETLPRTIVPVILWICVSLTLRYGYYGNHQIILGPNSSRLLQASSFFVQEIQVRDEAQKGIFIYGFSQKPELLDHEANWSISHELSIDSFRRQGISLWLNKGSRIRIRWTVHTHRFYDDIDVVFLKGEENFRRWRKGTTTRVLDSKPPNQGMGGADYNIEDDDSYYIGTLNLNPERIKVKMDVDLSTKMYDTSKADCNCSTHTGLCSLKLLFPNTHYALLTTPNTNVTGDTNAWYVELSFAARLATYIIILGFIVVIICLILKYLGACDVDGVVEVVNQNRNANETDALVPQKEVISCSYGSVDEADIEYGMSSSSEDLYDGKICVICYDEPRNSFFIPCGHCATCYTCAKRVENGETKCCPICRRLIHKVRRLINS